MRKVTVDVYQPGENDPYFEDVMTIYDDGRSDDDQVYVSEMPNGDRIFVHVEELGVGPE